LIWAIKKLKCEHLWHIPKSELSLTYVPSNQKILFRGLDAPDSITSITVDDGFLCWLWLEEAYQITSEIDFNKLDLSFRGSVPAPLFKQLSLSLNPWNDLHWIKPRFFDNPDDDVFSQTKTFLENEYLDAADYNVFIKMKKNNPKRYLVEALGFWGACEGAIYQNYIDDPEKNHVENIADKLYLLTVGVDYGSGTKEGRLGKTTLTVCGITPGFEKVFVLHESYFDKHFLPDLVINWIIENITDLQKKYKLPIEVFCEWASSSVLNNALKLKVSELELEGVDIQDAFKSTILARVDLVSLLLSESRLLLTPAVPELKKALLSATWDSEKSKLKKIPIRRDDGSSNICSLDCLEYAITSYSRYLLAAGKGTDT
jgi:PBSX family phage terminase large subunit